MQVQAYLLLQDLLIVVWYSHEFSGIGSELIGAHRFGHWVWRLQVRRLYFDSSLVGTAVNATQLDSWNGASVCMRAERRSKRQTVKR